MKVFIYTFGKVGSSTLKKSIRQCLPVNLQKQQLDIKSYPPFSSLDSNVVHTHDHYVVRQYLETGEKCKIISVYRELIDHTISAFFQNICNRNNWRCNYLFYVGTKNDINSLSVNELIEIFLQRVIEYHPEHWFNILNRTLNINIFHRSFNKDNGYQIYEGKNFELLILRYDRLNQMTDIIKDFLGLANFEFENANLSTEKWYSDLYSQFKESFRPPDWMITRYLKSQVQNYFMDRQETQSLINYYRRPIKTISRQKLTDLNKIKYISQKGQDKWVIEEIFKGKEKGFFVDLAATDGVKLSNTYILEKYYGWTGICIEPNPDFYASLIQNRSCLCVNDCIDSQEKIVEFRFDNGELGGIISDDTDNCIKYRNEQIKKARHEKKTAFLKTKKLDTVLDENSAPKIIDYLSLDVEGSETRILSNFPFEKYIFLALTIERPTPQLNQILFKNNYVFVQNSKLMPYDSFYVHKSIPNFDAIKKEPFSQVPPKDW